MSLTNSKMKSLKDKHEELELIEKKKVEVEDKIDELVGEKKSKISKVNKK